MLPPSVKILIASIFLKRRTTEKSRRLVATRRDFSGVKMSMVKTGVSRATALAERRGSAGRDGPAHRALSNATNVDDWTGILLEPLAQLDELRLVS
jgi:hypothetical protein